jgi:hypothetical protein
VGGSDFNDRSESIELAPPAWPGTFAYFAEEWSRTLDRMIRDVVASFAALDQMAADERLRAARARLACRRLSDWAVASSAPGC